MQPLVVVAATHGAHRRELTHQRRLVELLLHRLASSCGERTAYSDGKANRTGRDFGWEMISRGRFATPTQSNVARTGGYTLDANKWALCLVQGPFSVAPCQTLIDRFATLSSLCCTPRAGGVFCHVSPSRERRWLPQTLSLSRSGPSRPCSTAGEASGAYIEGFSFKHAPQLEVAPVVHVSALVSPAVWPRHRRHQTHLRRGEVESRHPHAPPTNAVRPPRHRCHHVEILPQLCAASPV